MLQAYEELRAKADEVWRNSQARTVIRVPIATCSIAAGARETLEAIEAAVKERGLDVDVQTVGAAAFRAAAITGAGRHEPEHELDPERKTEWRFGRTMIRRLPACVNVVPADSV